MIVDKIKIYLFFQMMKYFFLMLFIFLSVAWILQITRLLTITNFLNIEVLDIFILSIYLIPNIVTIIIPFILIFGLLICFVKLNRDNELIAMLSLGFGLKPFRKTLMFFCLTILMAFTLLNFYLAPKVYGQYKIKEYDLRNTLDFDKMVFSNFLNLNKTTILDFNKEDNEYKDIFISFNDDKENIVYAKKGNIFSENNQYNFRLTNGFKISIDSNKQIEKLEFLNYVLKIENQNITNEKIIDQNTFTIYDNYKSENYLNISFKLVDILLIIYIILLFYRNNLRDLSLNTINNIYFSSSCICILIINQILKNSEISIYYYLTTVIIISLLISNIKKKYEQN